MPTIIQLIEPDDGEVMRLVIVDSDGRDLAGLAITETGNAVLTTWPDGEVNERAELQIRVKTP